MLSGLALPLLRIQNRCLGLSEDGQNVSPGGGRSDEKPEPKGRVR